MKHNFEAGIIRLQITICFQVSLWFYCFKMTVGEEEWLSKNQIENIPVHPDFFIILTSVLPLGLTSVHFHTVPHGVILYQFCFLFFWHTLGPSVPTEHHLNTTAYLSPFMIPSSVDHFQQNNAPSQSSSHPRLVSWMWQWVHCNLMVSIQ